MPKVTIDVDFKIGDIVYLKLARRKHTGMVICLVVSEIGVIYVVSWESCDETRHYAIELTSIFERPDYDPEEDDD